MADAPLKEIIPIFTDANGRMRVSGTRVLLDLIVYAYHQGQTPENIVQMYPSLSLEQIYLAIGYYLRNRNDVDAYIKQMEQDAEVVQKQIEQDFPQQIITRSELLARLKSKFNENE
jgi:uncharacterized protein (DUF433 family)